MQETKEMDGIVSVMKYKKIRTINITPKKQNELWCEVVFDDNTRWLPRMEDVACLYNFIGICEDFKYKPHGQGADFAFTYFKEVYERQCNTIEEARQLYIDKYDPNKKTKRLYKNRGINETV